MTSRAPDVEGLTLLTSVARTGSVGAAARSLGLAQPNASRTLARLERDLGLTLLDRGPTGSPLTPHAARMTIIDERGMLSTSHHRRSGACPTRPSPAGCIDDRHSGRDTRRAGTENGTGPIAPDAPGHLGIRRARS